MNELELWVDIVGYEGLYQVSSLGRVRSLDRGMHVRQDRYKQPRWTNRKGKILKTGAGSDGYLIAMLCKDGKPKNHRVHRLVALHFISNPESKPAINHINCNQTDNRAANLEWCTIAENNAHSRALGRGNHRQKTLQ